MWYFHDMLSWSIRFTLLLWISCLDCSFSWTNSDLFNWTVKSARQICWSTNFMSASQKFTMSIEHNDALIVVFFRGSCGVMPVRRLFGQSLGYEFAKGQGVHKQKSLFMFRQKIWSTLSYNCANFVYACQYSTFSERHTHKTSKYWDQQRNSLFTLWSLVFYCPGIFVQWFALIFVQLCGNVANKFLVFENLVSLICRHISWWIFPFVINETHCVGYVFPNISILDRAWDFFPMNTRTKHSLKDQDWVGDEVRYPGHPTGCGRPSAQFCYVPRGKVFVRFDREWCFGRLSLKLSMKLYKNVGASC